MNIQRLFFLIPIVSAMLSLQSCNNRSSNDVWEDTKTAGRHVQRGVRSLGGKQGDSRQIRSRNDFSCIDDEDCYPPNGFQDGSYQDSTENQFYGGDDDSGRTGSYSNAQAYDSDYVPIQDPSNSLNYSNNASRPARESPGDQGSSIPGIQAFRDPATHPEWASVFRPIYFDYDSSLIKGQQNLQSIHTIADFLRSHPNVYIFVEGHTDERGPQAYNLALGSRRANIVRDALINNGASPDQVFTVSYGKERPVILEQHEEGHAKNRRAEFKIYER